MREAMNSIWFTSDTHFGHQNILEYEKEARPFTCLEDMHEALIDRWNSVVKPNDTVYHLGDLCFGRKNIAIAERLNGKKRLIMGNHDTYPSALYLQHFEKVYGVLHWHQCILSHVPVHPDSLGSRWFLNLHGHLHSRTIRDVFYDADGNMAINEPDLNFYNVSVEQNNLTPFHADEILQRLKELNHG
jgi:calcineurin-like phosphoesterase family protein